MKKNLVLGLFHKNLKIEPFTPYYYKMWTPFEKLNFTINLVKNSVKMIIFRDDLAKKSNVIAMGLHFLPYSVY